MRATEGEEAECPLPVCAFRDARTRNTTVRRVLARPNSLAADGRVRSKADGDFIVWREKCLIPDRLMAGLRSWLRGAAISGSRSDANDAPPPVDRRVMEKTWKLMDQVRPSCPALFSVMTWM